jgi:MinD superfamily P-loop ATPase
MAKVKRNMIKINQELCNGCGRCVSPCAEGAIEIVNGKARVIRDELCDGAGFCLGVCPVGALTIEKVETDPFSEEAVHEHKEQLAQQQIGEQHIVMKCSYCTNTEHDVPLLPVKTKGNSEWCCVRCLPRLIHG